MSEENSFRRKVLLELYICFALLNAVDGCSLQFKGKTVDLSQLDWLWPVSTKFDGIRVDYEINLCRPVHSPESGSNCSDSIVCRTENDASVSLAKFEGNTYRSFLKYDLSFLRLRGSRCSENPEQFYTIIFHFKCGPSIGAPDVYFTKQCEIHFLWITSVVCDNPPKRKEVPCYVYDREKGEKHDLHPLIKWKGGYRVAGNGTDSLIINVCSDISPDDVTGSEKCPLGVAACLERSGKFYNAGNLNSSLSYTRYNKLLQITYVADGTVLPPGCSNPPRTKIMFLCPQQQGLIRGPQLISSRNCEFEILWEVMYACPEEAFSGDLKTCKFTNGKHNLEFDLSPLRIPVGDKPYHVTSTINNASIEFFLNVCGGLGNDFNCNGRLKPSGWKITSACLKDSFNGVSKPIGTLKDARLHFVDGNITLVYTGGEGCNGTNASWRTVINFMCNRTAGDGRPMFSAQDECIYYFEWHTVHACPKENIKNQCMLVNGSVEIDLQNLHKKSGSEGWHVIDGTTNASNRRQILLNMCDFLETSGIASKCPNDTSICLINKPNGAGISLGRYNSPPEYKSEVGAVVLNYFDGDSCDGGRKIESQIKLFCHIGHATGSPVLVKESNCFYEFEWYTDASCPRSEHRGKDCKIVDENLGFHVDLSPLTSDSAYKINDFNYTLYLNVCGPVKGTECNFKKNASNMGGCGSISNLPEESFSLGDVSSEIAYKDGLLTLQYNPQKISETSQNNYGTKILFICDPSAGKGKPLLMDKIKDYFLFMWYTSHACLRKIYVDCLAVDSRTGTQYDLSSLTLSHGKDVWSAVDLAGKNKFYLNVCHPLGSQPLCSEKAAVCAVNLENGEEKEFLPNLGQSLSSPSVQSDGHLILQYNHGQECDFYGEKANYSTIIHFMCHKGNADKSIRFLDSFGPCNFAFLWATEAACAVEIEVAQDTCNITDPVSGQIYNLNSLKLANGFYNVSDGVRKFRLNICGSVGNSGCGSFEGKDVSACEVLENEKPNILGLTDHYSLRVSEDVPVRLSYSDAAGDDTVEINFKCADETSAVHFVEHHHNKYYFEIATPLACKQQPIYCSASGPKGESYDLSSLGHMPFRIAFDTRPQMTNWHYEISFCSPLDIVENSPCVGASACRVNLVNKERESLGHQNKTPELAEDGSVIVHFTSGSLCSTGKGTNSAEVKLLCSYAEKELVFLGVSACHYKFLLETPEACPIQAFNGSNCSVKNLVTGHVFDLSHLRRFGSDYVIKHREYTYFINVCSELVESYRGCEESAVCQKKSTNSEFAINTGLPSDELFYEDGVITLTYKGGKGSCHRKYNRSTVIKFVCDYTTTGSEGPTFVSEEDDCTYGFLWKTAYACPPHEIVNCTVTNDRERSSYQLDTLAWLSDNYYVKDPRNPNRTFVLNVCRTLIPQSRFYCSPSSAACVLDKSEKSRGRNVKAVSIGNKLSSPKIVDGKVILSYADGEICYDNGKKFETIIEFGCNPQEKFTTPEFVRQDGCKFFFFWETSAACPIVRREIVSNKCTVTNAQTGQVFDFSSLSSDKPTRVKVGSTQEFYISLCGHIPENLCGYGVGSCLMEKGKKVRVGQGNSLLLYKDGLFLLNYEGGDSCHGGKSLRNTLIRIMCSHQENSGPSFLSRMNDCTYVFVWYTPLACEKEILCVVDKDGVTIDLSVLTHDGNAVITHSIHSGSTYFMTVCRPLPYSQHSYCPPSAAVCKVPFGSSSSLSLGRLWKSPYLDEHQKITLAYKEGSPCPNNTSKHISSKIIFICDFSVGIGEPHLLEETTDECTYEFEWRTNVACTVEVLPKLPSGNCVFEDVEKRFTVDLSMLWRSANPHEVTSNRGSYLINVCGGTSTEGDCRNASVCFVGNNRQQVNYGAVENSSVILDGTRLLMNFDRPQYCQYTNEKMTTEIIFTCDATAGIGSPTLLEKYFPCSLTFLWKTSATCPRSLPRCTLFANNNFYDLRMFSSVSHSWTSIDDRGNFYWLNICNEVQPNAILAKNHHCPSGSAVCRVGKDGQGFSIGSVSSQKLDANENDNRSIVLRYSDGEEMCSTSNGTKVPVSTIITLRCDKKAIEQPKFISGPNGNCTYKFDWKTYGACPKTDADELIERNGVLFDKNFPELRMNLSAHIYSVFNADEELRDKYVYLFNIGSGVKSDDNKNECYKAAVCQTKPSSDFYRDLGSISTRRFFFEGSDIRLTLTSHGKRCGKNKHKNVTTNIIFECAPEAGVGNPQFLYESNNCDYLFRWETSYVCSTSWESREKLTNTAEKPEKVRGAVPSAEVVVGLILGLALIVVLVVVFAKRERRTTFLYKVKNCFNNVKLPRYRYIQSSHVDGDPILLSPDEPMQRFHDESDGDLVT